jgi:hypothetical protein
MSTPSLPPHRTSKVLPNHGGITVHFQHRSTMLRVSRDRATLPAGAPETPLPVDCSGNASCPWPMDGNDALGDCGWAMCDHVNGTRSYGQGKPGFAQLTCPLDALESQYLKDSGGDNGSDEPMLVGPGGAWLVGIGGNPKAVVVDHLDVDVTDIPLRNYCIDQFYCVCMAWSVPDDVLAKFATGCSFLSADTPNPENGHFTPLTDVDADDNVRIITWGAWCWASPAFLASVQPQCFVTFSALQFGADGYDSHGRHVSDQAAKWVALGGSSALVAPVVAAFPPKASPPPAPADPTEMPANGVTVPAV